MRIQYFSDIHLEFGDLDVVKTDADLIVAAGDIGLGLQGLEWLKGFDKPVVYVAGNHEYYHHEYFTVQRGLRQGSLDTHVRYLERDSYLFGEVRFLGCTLWTELGGEENDQLDELMMQVNDFREIRYQTEVMGFSDYSLLHRVSRRWLLNQLKQPFDGKTVVVTHHAPTHWSWHESPNNIKRYAYCNDLKELFHNFEITAWFHGHTHGISDYCCAGARILCNPRGYYPDHRVAEFDLGRTVMI